MQHWIILTGIIVVLFTSGCSLTEVRRQANLLDYRASIHGKVIVKTDQKGPLKIHLYQIQEGYVELVDKMVLFGSRHYSFDALPGTYIVGMFIDVNQDDEHQMNEHATYLGMDTLDPKLIELVENKKTNAGTVTIRGPLKVIDPDYEKRITLDKATQNIGKITSLRDAMFSHEAAALGFWRPFDFVEQYGGGLMMLQAFEEEKTPVVFVHGILGSSSDFEKMIDELDRKKFQPWVLHYPSGVSLDLVSDYFLKALNQLYLQYQFPSVKIVAHSMGGLVTRSFVMKYQKARSPYQLSSVITINSPFYGMDSAKKSLKISPLVIPVWRDVASDSEFTEKLHTWDWPKTMPYHLVFHFYPIRQVMALFR